MTWTITTDAGNRTSIVKVNSSAPARSFRLWTATSPVRDFRKAQWTSAELRSDDKSSVSTSVQAPGAGYRAFLVEAELFDSDGKTFKLSTEARVIPANCR